MLICPAYAGIYLRFYNKILRIDHICPTYVGIYLKTKEFVILVDAFRNGLVFRDPKNRLYERQTNGRYRVAAKNETEAEEIARKSLGFGSPKVYYEPSSSIYPISNGTIKREDLRMPNKVLLNPIHATSDKKEIGNWIYVLSNSNELKEAKILFGEENINYPFKTQKEDLTLSKGYRYLFVNLENMKKIQLLTFSQVTEKFLFDTCNTAPFSYTNLQKEDQNSYIYKLFTKSDQAKNLELKDLGELDEREDW